MQLTIFDLSHNKITELPDSIGELAQLTILDLSDNQLTELPDSIEDLVQLTNLDLHCNQLTDLPPGIILLININISKFDKKISNICGNCGKRYYKLSSVVKSHNKCLARQ